MYSILIYGFPAVLVVFEYLIRFLIGVDTFGFMGPTLAAAGITTLVSTVRPKTKEILDQKDGRKYLVTSKLDSNFVALSWILLFVMLFVWIATCHASITSSHDLLFGYQSQFAYGALAYFVCIVMVMIKEVV